MAEKTINQLTEDTSPTSGDFLASWDGATSTTKKITLGNIPANAAKFSNPYKFHAYRSAAWTNTSADQKMLLDAEVFDTGSNFDAVTNNRFIAPVAGFYQINFSVSLQQASGIGYGTYLNKNGSINVASGAQVIATQTTAFSVNVPGTCMIQLSVSDYIELRLVGGTGGQIGATGANATYMSGFLVSLT